MTVLRTPEEKFRDLPDFPYQPHHFTVEDRDFGPLRLHYLDEGDAEAPVVLCLHGQGSWSYLYRHMIPPLTRAGYRVIAPDFIGFGRSDKLPAEEDYTFQKHVDWLTAFLKAMALKDLTGYLFDWGAFFGLRIAAENPEIFQRLVISNARLPTGREPGMDWFVKWREGVLKAPRFPIGDMVKDGTRKDLSTDEIAAYDAPFPDERFKTGPRRFPMILPISPEDPASAANTAAWQALAEWNKPVLTLFSAMFARSRAQEALTRHMPGASGQPHQTYEDAGFYLVEDKGPELAKAVIAFIEATPLD